MQTVSKPYAAHGWLAVKASYFESGEYIFNVINPDKFPLLLYTKGCITVKDRDTGEIASIRKPGYWNKIDENFSKLSWVLSVQAGSEVWCFDPTLNNGIVPPAELFSLEAGQSVDISAGKKLFLCDGSFTADGKTVTGPAQVSVNTDRTLNAITQCFGVWLP